MSSTAAGSPPPPKRELTAGEEFVPYDKREWTRPWMGRFLEVLSTMPNVSAAAHMAGIGRETAYDWRHRDEAFAAAWKVAYEVAMDAVEREIHRRAMLGFDKTIRRTVIKRDEAGAVLSEEVHETTVHEVSDGLLLALARAGRPERWRERYDIRHAGSDGGPVQHEVVAAKPRSRQRVLELARLALELEAGPGTIEGEAVEVNGDGAPVDAEGPP